jgi:hypothetical protein
MQKLFKYYRRTRKDLKALLYIFIATYFLIEFVFNNYNEIFNGAHKLAVFFSDISISYISSFIFYFIVVQIKSEEDKANINELIGQKVYSIITSGHLLIQPFLVKKDKKANFEYLNRIQLRKLLSSFNKRDNEAPLSSNGKNKSWLEWYEYLKESTEEDFRIINVRYNLLDAELIKILSRIENSLFFYQFELLYNDVIGETFAMFEIQIFSYLNLIKELEVYADKNLSEFKYRKGDFVGLN